MSMQQDSRAARALDLVAQLYEAALGSSQWPRFLEALADATDSEGAIIWLHDCRDSSAELQSADLSFACEVNFAPGATQSYAEHYTYVNPWLRHIEAASEGVALDSSTICADSELHRGEFYADWLRPQRLAYALGGPILKRDGVIAMFSLLRPERHGAYRAGDLRLLQLLMPHLRRACLLHRRVARLHAQRSGGLAALELLPTAVWLLDAEGRLLFANQAGRSLDAQRDGLWVGPDGRPLAHDPREQQTLRRLVAGAIAAGKGMGLMSDGALRISRYKRPTPLQLMVYPLGCDVFVEGSAAAVFIFDPALKTPPHDGVLRALYGLTRTEARLAAALAQGDSLTEYCRANGVTANTARTHLKRALAKTGTNRQAQLVALVASMPAMRRPVVDVASSGSG